MVQKIGSYVTRLRKQHCSADVHGLSFHTVNVCNLAIILSLTIEMFLSSDISLPYHLLCSLHLGPHALLPLAVFFFDCVCTDPDPPGRQVLEIVTGATGSVLTIININTTNTTGG
jgi:hypothetical protein